MAARNDIKNLKVRAAVDTLCANIGFAEVDTPIKSVAVVSAMPADGKSTVALALAEGYATQGARTLLVECDLRRRVVAHRLGIHRPDAPGLRAAVLGRAEMSQVVVPTSFAGLWLLDAEPGITNPSKLFSSKRFERFAGLLRDSWDYVTFDTPPLGAFVDGALVAAVADATLLVVRPNHTQRRVLVGAYEQLCKAGANVVGTVANGVDDEPASDYYYARPAESETRRKTTISGAHAIKAGERSQRLWKRGPAA